MFIRNNPAAVPSLPQGASSQTSWDPNAISNAVFGAIMVFIGIIALWQGRRRVITIEDEELVLIRPVHNSTASPIRPQCVTNAAIEYSPHQQTLQHLPDGLLSIHSLSTGIDRLKTVRDTDISFTPNRVTTLSTLASAEPDSWVSSQADVDKKEE